MGRSLNIACANSCKAKYWSNESITLDDLKQRLKTPVVTAETVTEYKGMNQTERGAAKDHGGFVAGVLRDGRRKIDHVESRSMITLDGDHIGKDFLDDYENRMPYASILYSTHSSTPDEPRARILIPLTRDITPEEYNAVSRYLAMEFGMDHFDDCSYRPNQMMYWPSVSKDGSYMYKETDGPWLDPDQLLASHPEWTDPTKLPRSGKELKNGSPVGRSVKDPLKKNGPVGLFNNAYFPIQKAVDKYLSGVYELSEDGSRYRYIPSDSMAGVEILGEGKFLYSHHATDPAGMRLCNAFDIVRIHLFGDEKASFTEMVELASKDEEVKLLALDMKCQEAEDDFKPGGGGSSGGAPPGKGPPGVSPPPAGPDDWKKKLKYNAKTMKLENSLQNLLLILKHDPKLQNIVFNQLADGIEIKGPVPWKHPARFWRDADDAQLVTYIDAHYGSFSQRNYELAITKVTDDRAYHPIREMFESLPPWDGISRVETLLIDYLDAEDNEYVRAITRKILVAAYLRVYQPGLKFDYILVLNGPQGIGKSTLIQKLGMDWFCDSLAISDMNDKTAAEKLQGFWIHEIGEMAGMKKADIEKVKAFISRSDDKYRASFGRRVTPHPRQCVFFGTTNTENGYLRDITGNRRFWNVKVTGEGLFKPWELDTYEVKMIWAEVKLIAEAGEELFLPVELEDYARGEQRHAMESDDREGLVRVYLDRKLPKDWYTWDEYKRRHYFQDPSDPTLPAGTMDREWVSNIEIWSECFGRLKSDIRPSDSYAISAIMVRISEWEKNNQKMRDKCYGQQRVYTRKKVTTT